METVQIVMTIAGILILNPIGLSVICGTAWAIWKTRKEIREQG